ncbi:MAG: hypothetical protein VXZ27_00440, partial [SAR324 cluster bacterium]|nr:hypothetical protein [SAR324 cluster bacterium]
AAVSNLTDDGYNDQVPPVITVNGNNPETVELGTSYTDAGATAFDEFHGDNAGLVVAEIELENEEQPFAKPPWLGEEVSQDPRYLNINLSQHPYCQW